MKAVKVEANIHIEDGYLYRESIKEIPGRRYDAESKAWLVPCNKKNAELLQMLGAELDEELYAFVKPVCKTLENDEQPLRTMPIKAKPYKHQVKAFNFAMSLYGADRGEYE